jgi:hypothetical protein
MLPGAVSFDPLPELPEKRSDNQQTQLLGRLPWFAELFLRAFFLRAFFAMGTPLRSHVVGD